MNPNPEITISPVVRKISDFLAKVIIAIGEGQGGVKLSINDSGERARHELVKEYAVSPEREALRFALEIAHDAQEQADGSGAGLHRFTLHAYRGGEKSHFLSYAFMVSAENVPEESYDESINSKSFMAQLHRHNEATQKNNAQLLSISTHAYESIIEMLTQMNMQYQQSEMMRMQLLQQLIVDKAKFDNNAEMQKFMHDIVKQLMQLGLPIVLPKIIEAITKKPNEEEKLIQSTVPKAIVEPVRVPELPAAIVEHETTPKNGHSKPKPRSRK